MIYSSTSAFYPTGEGTQKSKVFYLLKKIHIVHFRLKTPRIHKEILNTNEWINYVFTPSRYVFSKGDTLSVRLFILSLGHS